MSILWDKALSLRNLRFALLSLFILTAGTWLFSRALLSTGFLPHWYCYLGDKRLLWTTVIADLLIGLSYVAISVTLVWLIRHCGRSLPFPSFFWAFGIFIVSCGATHFLEVVTVWKPVYWLSAAAKILTAFSSAGTAIVLILGGRGIVAYVQTTSEAAQRVGNEKFRALVQAAPMAVLGLGTEGRTKVWNPAAERMLGQRLGAAMDGEGGFIPADRIAEHEDLLRRAQAGEVITGFETVWLHADGSPFRANVSFAPIYSERHELEGVMAVVEDITARKRVDFELQQKTATLAAVTQALTTFLDSGNWSTASRHLLHLVMRETRSEFGFLGVTLEGDVLRVLAHDGVVWDQELNRSLYEEKMHQYAEQGHFEVSHFHNLLAHVISQKEPIISNFPAQDPRSGGLPAGHPPIHSFFGVPVFKGDHAVGLIAVANRPGGYSGQDLHSFETMLQATGVLFDNYRQNLKRKSLETEQKNLESQMRQAQKMEVLGRLSGGIAHDFNNVLMVLTGFSELLEQSIPPDSQARKYLSQIQRATERAAGVTKQLLAFSRKQVLELRPINLHEALCDMEIILSHLLGSDVRLEFCLEAAEPWILSDLSQIGQVVANLTINARDAMPEGGSLKIRTWNTDALPDGADKEPGTPRNWIVLEVADSGIGMDELTRAQIFDPFFTTKPAGKGTGLGLSTVYGIVKQSGGSILVESAPGKGSQFKLYFPATESGKPALPAVPQAAPAKVSGVGATVLVVEDESALRYTLVEVLQNSSYRVLQAANPVDALEMATQFHGTLDILLTDIVMPGIRGTELARRINALHPETRVIFMSGYAEGLPEKQLPPNAAFLQKPFPFSTLLEQLKLAQSGE